MSLVSVDLPSPRELRGGWAALAAVCVSRGWTDSAYSDGSQWYYHDGGGNWACIRFADANRAVLFGHDHEYSETYFRASAIYFNKEETNLLLHAPEWWDSYIGPSPFGEWIGFIYGWDGAQWQRAVYDKPDGFSQVGLLRGCSVHNTSELSSMAADAPGLKEQPPNPTALSALVAADANITYDLLAAVVPGWNIPAGVAAGRKFLETRI